MKIKFISVVLLTLLSVNANANVKSEINIHPYVGVGFSNLKVDAVDKDIQFGDIVTGLQFNDYLGLEANWSKNISKIESGVVKSDLTNYGVAVTFQADLHQNWYVKSSLGYAKTQYDVSDEKIKFNSGVAKLGVGYQLAPSLATEVTYNYQFYNDDVGNNQGVAVQFKYYF